MRKINEIIIHCADTPNGKEFHNTDIDKWHKERGWSGIGYHYVICIDGTIEPGRDVALPGAHCEGNNSNSIGICMIGKDKFTQAQWEGLALLVNQLVTEYGIKKITGHCEHPSAIRQGKTCPNFSVSDWIVNYIPAVQHVLL